MQRRECNKHNYLLTYLIFPRVLFPCENRGVTKCAKVSDRKTMPSKAPTAPKSVGAASSKAMLRKATHAKSVMKTSVAAGSGALPKPGAPSGTAVSRTPATVIPQRAGVLKISIGTKMSAAAPSPTAIGKHVRIDVKPPLVSIAALKASVRS
jgi:hypothetical protein